MSLPIVLVVAFVAWFLWKQMSGRTTMPPAEARRLLEVPVGAGPQDIADAHRRLIARVHPDAGGSAELARRVNVARDVLIAECRKAG